MSEENDREEYSNRIASLERELSRHANIEEKDHLQTIDERDRAEEALSQAYYLITGKSPEWSNLFGYDEALEDINDAQKCLRADSDQALRVRVEAAEKALALEKAAHGETRKALRACHLQLLQSNNDSEYAQEACELARAALALNPAESNEIKNA